jgi:hypothetical protein
MKRALAVAFAAMLSLTTFANDLPNDCALIATQAFSRVEENSAWSRVLMFAYLNLETGLTGGHAVMVWQINDKSAVLMYDRSGTIELPTHSHELLDVIAEINKLIAPTRIILKAHYAE